MTSPATEERIGHARQGLDEKLAEIERRVLAAKNFVDPGRLFENQWFRVGLAFAVGFAAGYARDSAPMKTGMRLVLTAGAKHLLRDAFDRGNHS